MYLCTAQCSRSAIAPRQKRAVFFLDSLPLIIIELKEICIPVSPSNIEVFSLSHSWNYIELAPDTEHRSIKFSNLQMDALSTMTENILGVQKKSFYC